MPSDCLAILRAMHLLFFVRTIFCHNAKSLLPLWRYPLTEAPEAEGRGRHTYDKGVYCALCLTHRNLANFWYSQEHGNSGCPDGMCNVTRPYCWRALVRQECGATYISGVGFRVARSTVPGNARASMRGTSDGENSHAFFVCARQDCFIRPDWEGCRTRNEVLWNKAIVCCLNTSCARHSTAKGAISALSMRIITTLALTNTRK